MAINWIVEILTGLGFEALTGLLIVTWTGIGTLIVEKVFR